MPPTNIVNSEYCCVMSQLVAGGCEETHQLPGGSPAGQEAAHLRPGDVVQ